MTVVVLDDHLLRDLLADDIGSELAAAIEGCEVATTNLFLVRLTRSVVAARGGRLTGEWSGQRRRELGRRLVALPDSVEVVPMRDLAYRMAELSAAHRISTLGSEAIAAAEHLEAALCVWEGDDGPAIRTAMTDLALPYRPIHRD